MGMGLRGEHVLACHRIEAAGLTMEPDVPNMSFVQGTTGWMPLEGTESLGRLREEVKYSEPAMVMLTQVADCDLGSVPEKREGMGEGSG